MYIIFCSQQQQCQSQYHVIAKIRNKNKIEKKTATTKHIAHSIRSVAIIKISCNNNINNNNKKTHAIYYRFTYNDETLFNNKKKVFIFIYYSNLCNFFTYNNSMEKHQLYINVCSLEKKMVCRQCMIVFGLLLLCCRNWCLKITWHIRNLLNCYYLTHLTIRFVIHSISLIKWILIHILAGICFRLETMQKCQKLSNTWNALEHIQ